MHGNDTTILSYLQQMGGEALVQVDILQDGFATLSLPDQPCCDFAVADGALAWSLPGGTRPHSVYAQHVVRQDDALAAWFEHEDTGYGMRVTLSPVWMPEQRAQVDEWLPQREAMAAVLQGRLAEYCTIAKAEFDRAGFALSPAHTYMVAGVDRGPGQGGRGLITVGCLVVSPDGQEFQFVGLPGVEDAGLAQEFSDRAAGAARAGVNWMDLFNFITSSGNGHTSDYSLPESVRTTSARRAGYQWLRKHFASAAPHLVA